MHRSKTAKFLVFGVPAITTLGFGIWQTKRYMWKTQLIQEREQTLSEPVLEKFDDSDVEKILYHKIRVTGTFDNEREVLVGMRKLQAVAKQGFGSFEDAGYYVVTPFHTTSGNTILVNRGWIPRQKIDDEGRKVNGQITLDVVVRDDEKPNFASLNGPMDRNIFLAMNVDHIQKYLGVKVAFLADQYEPLVGYDNQPVLNQVIDRHKSFYVMPPTHFVYALTWYSLCVWILGTAVYLRKKKML